MKQTTIKNSITLTGMSITGEPYAKISFCPAPPNTGIVVVRNDLAGRPKINCSFKNAKVDFRWTSLLRGNFRIEHTEHALAAISGLGIDNLFIELSQPSFPVMEDYGSGEFAKAILQAGLIEQPCEKKFIKIVKPIIVHKYEKLDNAKIDKLLIALPYNGFKVTYVLDYPHCPQLTQAMELVVNSETFISELANARSFILHSEIEEVINLTGDASKKVLLVYNHDDSKTWTWPNELARHKALDLLGDLSLLGKGLLGHVIGIRSGHRLNLELCKKINRECKS